LKEQVVRKMMPPTNETVPVLSQQYGVTEGTLYTWRREALKSGVAAPGDGRNAEAWTSKAKFAVVLETASLAEAELGEYCRAKGLYPEQVRAWRSIFESAMEPAAAGSMAASRKGDQKRIRELEKDLRRKERALAETAALLVLRKKAAAIWGEQEDE
jgi:transposase-like protein